MVLVIEVIMWKVRSMEQDASHGLMEVLIQVSFMRTILKALVYINGQMAENMMVLGKTIKWKGMVFLHGLMVENMRESI